MQRLLGFACSRYSLAARTSFLLDPKNHSVDRACVPGLFGPDCGSHFGTSFWSLSCVVGDCLKESARGPGSVAIGVSFCANVCTLPGELRTNSCLAVSFQSPNSLRLWLLKCFTPGKAPNQGGMELECIARATCKGRGVWVAGLPKPGFSDSESAVDFFIDSVSRVSSN